MEINLKQMLSVNVILVLFILILSISSCGNEEYKIISENNNTKAQLNKDSSQAHDKVRDNKLSSIDTAVVTHIAIIRTSMGRISVGLFGEAAPETVANFIGLSKMNYYKGVLFHRVAKDFLIQAGDRNTLFQEKKSEWGLGGQSFYGGDIEDEIDHNAAQYRRGYVKGTVAMANKGPNTNTSQFFICLDEAKKLEPKWTIFGKVVAGMKAVENISGTPVEKSQRGNNDGIPIKPVRIYDIEIKLIKSPNI